MCRRPREELRREKVLQRAALRARARLTKFLRHELINLIPHTSPHPTDSSRKNPQNFKARIDRAAPQNLPDRGASPLAPPRSRDTSQIARCLTSCTSQIAAGVVGTALVAAADQLREGAVGPERSYGAGKCCSKRSSPREPRDPCPGFTSLASLTQTLSPRRLNPLPNPRRHKP